MMASDAVAVKAAANVSFSYNAPAFLILRIGLLAGHPVEARELIALEAGVQKAVDRLVAQIDVFKQELSREQALNVQLERGTCRAQAELEVKLLSSQASQNALQQMLDRAHADMFSLRQQLRDTQLALLDSQHDLEAAADSADDLRVQLQNLKLLQQQQGEQQQKQQQQQADNMAGTPSTCKAQLPIQAEQPADTAADTIRQQDQRTPQAAPDPHQLLQDAAQHDQSPGQRGAPQRPPVLRHVPSPLLSPSPTPNTARRSGRESPLTPKLPSRIPGAPEAAARAGASLSYAAALRRSQTALEGAAAASADSGVVGSAGAGAGDAGAPTGSKASVFKFTAAPHPSTAAIPGSSSQKLFGGSCKPFTAGTGPTSSTSRFGSGTGSISSRSRRAVRSAQSGSKPAHVQPPVLRTAIKLPKTVCETDCGADSPADARKRRWR